MRKLIHTAHETAHAHKKHVLALTSIVVLVLHYVNPEMEAWGFCVAGVICTEFA